MSVKKSPYTYVVRPVVVLICIVSAALAVFSMCYASKGKSTHTVSQENPTLLRVTLYGSIFLFGKTEIDVKNSQITYLGNREEGGEHRALRFGSFNSQISSTETKGITTAVDHGRLRQFKPVLSWFKPEWANRETLTDGKSYLVLRWTDREVVFYIPPSLYVSEGLKEKSRKTAYQHLFDLQRLVCRIEDKYMRASKWSECSGDEEAKLRDQLQKELRAVDKRSLPQGRKGW